MTDIFISFKNTFNEEDTIDAEYARKIFDRLTDMKFNVFMMNETLQDLGAANYKKSIDQALDEAKCIIVVGSKKEFFESDWIRYEWDTYLSEVLAGRKEENIFTFRAGDVSIGDLPISLRKYQSFIPEKEELLYAFAGQSLAPSNDDNEIIDYDIYPAVIFYEEDVNKYVAAIFDLEIYAEGETVESAYMDVCEFAERWFETAIHYDIKRPEPTPFEMMKEMYPENDVLLVNVKVTKGMLRLAEANMESNNKSDSNKV